MTSLAKTEMQLRPRRPALASIMLRLILTTKAPVDDAPCYKKPTLENWLHGEDGALTQVNQPSPAALQAPFGVDLRGHRRVVPDSLILMMRVTKILNGDGSLRSEPSRRVEWPLADGPGQRPQWVESSHSMSCLERRQSSDRVRLESSDYAEEADLRGRPIPPRSRQ